MPKLAIVGPQFSDPALFGGWLARHCGFKLGTIEFGTNDRALVARDVTIADRAFDVHVLLRACWEVDLAHMLALTDADHVVLALCQARQTLHLNEDAVGIARKYIADSARVVAAINDPYCRRRDFPLAEPEDVSRLIPTTWRTHVTTCGDFSKPDKCEKGVLCMFEDLLGASLTPPLLPPARVKR